MAKRKNKKKIKKKFKQKIKILILTLLLITLIVLGIKAGEYYLVYNEELIPIDEEKEYYNLSDFGFIRELSETDYDNDGIDDYTDILNGEKKEAERNPKYVSAYYANGYPPDGEGVCTDVVWRALKEAGYDLKSMISTDIRLEEKAKKDTYDIDIIDDNIDFRRVDNQETFFIRYLPSLTTNIYKVGEFQPGDIVTFDYSDHVAMISDKYNKNGVPFLIQNRDETQKEKEEDRLEITDMEVTGHYRFEYSEKLQEIINKISA